MAKRGPPRTPAAILTMRGSTLAASRGNEPQPIMGAPPLPDDLGEPAELVWANILEQLDTMGMLAVCDGNALERYCRLVVEWRKLQAFIDQAGTVYTLYLCHKITGEPLRDASGNKMIRYRQQHPEVGARNKLSGELLKLEIQFGFTPGARASIDLGPATNIPTVRSRVRGPA